MFKKKGDGKLWAGVRLTRKEDISHAVIRKVQYTVRSASFDWKSDIQDFPGKSTKPNSALSSSWGINLNVTGNPDCLDIEVGLIFNDVEKQVKSVNDYLDSHPDTIGHLTDKDLEELKELRQTEMKFYTDENESELVLTEMVDLHAMAQMSKFIRGLLRFKRNQDGELMKVPLKTEKLISEHFNRENITDLIGLLHGRQFRRRYFLKKSIDYLTRLGYISNQFDIPALKLMIDDCLFNKAKHAQINDRNINCLTSATEYAVKTENSSLFERLNHLIRLFDFKKDSPEYEAIRSSFRKSGGLMLVTLLDAWKAED